MASPRLYGIKATGECRNAKCSKPNEEYTVAVIATLGTLNEAVRAELMKFAESDFSSRKWPCPLCGETLRDLKGRKSMFAASGAELVKNGYITAKRANTLM